MKEEMRKLPNFSDPSAYGARRNRNYISASRLSMVQNRKL